MPKAPVGSGDFIGNPCVGLWQRFGAMGSYSEALQPLYPDAATPSSGVVGKFHPRGTPGPRVLPDPGTVP